MLEAIARESWQALGTTAVVCVTDPYAIVAARGILSDELNALDDAASSYRDDSELAGIERRSGTVVAASRLLIEAIEVALGAADATDGLVDPTFGVADVDWSDIRVTDRSVQIPRGARLDLGSTGKALAADRAATRIATELSDTGVLVSLGGDIRTAGRRRTGDGRSTSPMITAPGLTYRGNRSSSTAAGLPHPGRPSGPLRAATAITSSTRARVPRR